MRHQRDVLAYARQQADLLGQDMTWEPSDHGGYWKAPDRDVKPRIVARAVAALEFFRQYAGEGSFWTQRALTVYQDGSDHQSTESGARAVGDLLRAWVTRSKPVSWRSPGHGRGRKSASSAPT